MEDQAILDYKICENIYCKRIFKRSIISNCPACKSEFVRKLRESDLIGLNAVASDSWIKTSYDLGMPCATLVFSQEFQYKDLGMPHFHNCMTQLEIVQLAKKIEEHIERIEPRLKGIIVVMTNYNVESRSWHMGAIHPAFPRHIDRGQHPIRIKVDARPGEYFLDGNTISLNDVFNQPIIVKE